MLMISTLLLLLLPTLISGLYDSNTGFIQVISGQSEFQTKVLDSDSIWVVHFYDPSESHSQNFASDYSKISNLFRGIIHLGAIDVTSSENSFIDSPLNKLSPTLKLFKDDKTPTNLKFKSDPNEIITIMFNALKDTIDSRIKASGGPSLNSDSSNGNSSSKKKMESAVVEITAENISSMVYENPLVSAIAFVAPWCGHCKALMPEWESASTKLNGSGAILGVVNAEVETDLATEYGIKGFPTIKLFPGGVGQSASSARDYQGGRDERKIVQNILEEVDRTGIPKEIPELTNAHVMEETCLTDDIKLCVLFALPHILDSGAEGRNKYKDYIRDASKVVRGMNFGFAWFEGGSEQGKLESTLGLDFGFPAMVAYSSKKGVYIVHRGSFNVVNIRKFLTGLTMGKQQTNPINKELMVKTVEPWDGQDGVPIEEESLADIMGDDWSDEF